jgi:putative DNA primase/helicase
VFPHYDFSENNGYVTVRPRSPRVRDGKPVKYEAPAGKSPRSYFPKRSRPQLRKGTGPIHVTEGAKKALKLSQHGYPAAGIIGVWNWKKKGSDELRDDLAAVQWAGRVVVIVFDYDPKAKTRWNVRITAKRLARALRNAGAREVYLVNLPPGREE